MEDSQREDLEVKEKVRSSTKCEKCKTRIARKGCLQNACLNCCTAMDFCEAHAESRRKQKYQEELLQGTTEITRLAQRDRNLAVIPGAFREPGFVSLQQTIKIWDLREFMANSKWKEDAIRKSLKRSARETSVGETMPMITTTATTSSQIYSVPSAVVSTPKLYTSRKRFRAIVDNWHNKRQEQNC